MTMAPQSLKDVRLLLLEHLDLHENSTAYPTDLDPDEVGVVGDPAHLGGYHCGRDRTVRDDYSVYESPRDRAGLSHFASGLDVGLFNVTVNEKRHDLKSFSVWLVAQCKANTADTADIREVIYSPDGKTVKRWDRLGVRSSGDGSHLFHTHISFFRDATKANRSLIAVFKRWLIYVGLIPAPKPSPPTPAPTTPKEITMFLVKRKDLDTVWSSNGVNRRVMKVWANCQALMKVGVPLLTVATAADLDDIAGPVATTTAAGAVVPPAGT